MIPGKTGKVNKDRGFYVWKHNNFLSYNIQNYPLKHSSETAGDLLLKNQPKGLMHTSKSFQNQQLGPSYSLEWHCYNFHLLPSLNFNPFQWLSCGQQIKSKIEEFTPDYIRLLHGGILQFTLKQCTITHHKFPLKGNFNVKRVFS